MPPDSTPFASWPRHLQASWRDCAERGKVDGHTPPTSVVEAYLQVAEARGRRLASIPWGDGRHDLADDEVGLLDAALEPKLVACAQCGAGELEHFYPAREGGYTLCAGCYARQAKRTVHKKSHGDG